jgi:hypothetical protein
VMENNYTPQIILKTEDDLLLENELLIRLSALVSGDINEIKIEVRKSLIILGLSKYDENSPFNSRQLLEKIFQITKVKLTEEQVIQILEDLVRDEKIVHISKLEYKTLKKFEIPEFDQISQSVWNEFSAFLKTKGVPFDLQLDKNTRRVFNAILLRILTRFTIEKPLARQIDELPLTDLRKVVTYEINQFYFPEQFAKKFEYYIIEYVSSSPENLLEFVLNCYCGLINLDLIEREHEMPKINFKDQFKFFLLDSSMIVTLLCESQSNHPLAVCVLEQCKKLNIPTFYTSLTKDEIWGFIQGSKSEMKGLHLRKGSSIRSQFVHEFLNKSTKWDDFVGYLNSWEAFVKTKWNILPLPIPFENKIDIDTYNFLNKALPLTDKIRFEERERRSVDYIPRLKSEKQHEHDAYCISLLVQLKNEYEVKEKKPLLGPVFISFDNILAYINLTNLQKKDDYGYVIPPRILINYFLAYSTLEFDEKDREYVALALLQYAAPIQQIKVTLDDYSRLIAEKINFGQENADIIKSIFLRSPLFEELRIALASGDSGGDAEVIATEIFSDPKIEEMVREVAYGKEDRKRNRETIERLAHTVKEMQKEMTELKETPQVVIYNQIQSTATSQTSTNVQISIENRNNIDELISILESKGIFKAGIIEKPPKTYTSDQIKSWLERLKTIIEVKDSLKTDIGLLLPFIGILLQHLPK